MDGSSSSPSQSPAITSSSSLVLTTDVLNVSPNPAQVVKPELEKEHTLKSNIDVNSDGQTTPKSTAELVDEISALEVEIMRMERYLLSLYRVAFQDYLPTKPGNSDKQINLVSAASSGQPSPGMKTETLKNSYSYHGQSSPPDCPASSSDFIQTDLPKSASQREKLNSYIWHPSLADHLGSSHIDGALVCPDKLSEDIIRCISSIYCKLANPIRTSKKGCSVSSASSLCSSSTFSPRNLSGSWSPQCNEEVLDNIDFKSLKQDNSQFPTMLEVLKICLDDENYSYAATVLKNFRSLVKSLETVDPVKMKREEKLTFWINIHNALLMHAYLAYGTQNYIKSNCIMKAAYNVGGQCINAYDIQSSILGIRSHYPATWLQTLVSPGKKFKTGNTKHPYAIEYPEPLVHFALCSGSYWDPAVRIYKAKSVFEELEAAKVEFIRSTVYVHKEARVYLPKILYHYGKDMSMGMNALLEIVNGCVSDVQQDAIKACVKGRPSKSISWLEQTSSFRYLIHK